MIIRVDETPHLVGLRNDGVDARSGVGYDDVDSAVPAAKRLGQRRDTRLDGDVERMEDGGKACVEQGVHRRLAATGIPCGEIHDSGGSQRATECFHSNA